MNLIELQERFSTQRKCEEFLRKMRWPDGVKCPQCGTNHPYWIKTRKLWKCSGCGHQFTYTSGTIFHASRTPLQKWFITIWLMVESKKGVSAKQIERTIDVGYKTAWRMAMQIRQAMRPGYGFNDKLAGIVEADDAFIGGKKKGAKGPRDGKQVVVGVKERGGRMEAWHVPDLTAHTLGMLLDAVVSRDADLLCTDEHRGYLKAARWAYPQHKRVCHKNTFVNGNVHTQGVESFWSLFKRAIIGVYHRVSAKYLQAYLNEFVFRFNNRYNENIFETVLANC